MKLLLIRQHIRDTYTIGHLLIDGEYYCDVIEDRIRDRNADGDLDDQDEGKVYGETAIPYGTYDIELTYSPKFKRVLPMLKGVRHFTGIRIHRGNTAEDSYGCLIVGENKIPGKVINSTGYETGLIMGMHAAVKRKETIKIEIL